MTDFLRVQADWMERMESFVHEVEVIYAECVRPRMKDEIEPGLASSRWGMPETEYGFLSRIFSYVDLFGIYLRGNRNRREQNSRMLDFMERYMGSSRETAWAAIQLWRHHLVHFGNPRSFTEKDTLTTYSWNLQWDSPSPTLRLEGAAPSKWVAGTVFGLVRKVRDGVEKYLNDLIVDSALQNCFEDAEKQLNNLAVSRDGLWT